MASTVSRIIKAIRPHTPLIRFRKNPFLVTPSASDPAKAQMVDPSGSPETTGMGSGAAMTSRKTEEALEWYETPEKFKRRSLDTFECDAINCGGCSRMYQ